MSIRGLLQVFSFRMIGVGDKNLFYRSGRENCHYERIEFRFGGIASRGGPPEPWLLKHSRDYGACEHGYGLVERVARFDIREHKQVGIAAYRAFDSFYLGAVGVAGSLHVHRTTHLDIAERAGFCFFNQTDIIGRVGEFWVYFFREVNQSDVGMLDSKAPACGQIVAQNCLTLSQCRIGITATSEKNISLW